MKTIDQMNFSGEKVLIRVDFNVPLNDSLEITDDTRIQAALPTIKKVVSDGGSVILMSHLGRPKQGPEDRFSLRHLVSHLSELLGLKVHFVDDCVGSTAENAAKSLKAGEVLLLENVRFYPEETKGDQTFAEKLAILGSVYINDAFGTAHREHASTAVIARFFPDKSVFGSLMAYEIKHIEKVLQSDKKPVAAIIGGAKVSGKIAVITQLLERVDHILIGGGMSYTFIKAMGGQVGASLVENEELDTALQIIAKAKQKGVQLHLPSDSVNADRFDNHAEKDYSEIGKIKEGWMGLDIGQKTIAEYDAILQKAAVILWNGPMGVFEFENFAAGTREIAQSIVKASQAGAYSLVGGGDSIAALKAFGLQDQVSYVSTGGGAMLEYLEGKELPGIKALQQ